MPKAAKDQAFAIYHEGDLYTEYGRKTIYKTISAAKGVITEDSKMHARHHWEANNSGSFWDLPRDEQERLSKMYATQHFTIMEYGPVKQVWPL